MLYVLKYLKFYCNGNVGFKVFDFHARDLFTNSHPRGTCVLLEVSSVINFQFVNFNSIFEVKGVNITEVQNSSPQNFTDRAIAIDLS